MISHLDDPFGRLVAALWERGRLDDTLIVQAGDSGPARGRHGLMGKQNLYDHSVRGRLVFAGRAFPEASVGRRWRTCRTSSPRCAGCPGRRFPARSKAGASSLPERSRRRGPPVAPPGLRPTPTRDDGRHRLIAYFRGATQLFDLSRDPAETRKQADDDASRGIPADLRRRLVEPAEEWEDRSHRLGAEFRATRSGLCR